MQKTVHSLCLMAFTVIAGVVSAQEAAQAQQQPTTEAHRNSQAFSWSELNRVYQATMAEYNKKSAGKNASAFDVTSRLEAAGLAQAIEAPVKDISLRQAAAILNDYGFLAGSLPLAGPALRRAIELDPKRRSAYLNLADFIRNRMPNGTSSWGEIMAQWQKAEKLYRQYLALGGKETAHIQAFLRGDLGANNSEDSCAAIAAYANAGRLRELMNWRGNKLEIGEKTIDLWTETSGSMYMTVLVAADSASGEDVPIDNLIPEELNGVAGSNNGLGIVIYHKDLLIVYYKGIYPINSYSLQNGKKCTYPMTVKKTIGARAVDPQTCRALAAGKGKTLAFDVPAKIETKDVYPWLKNIGEQYQGADILGTVVADIANDSQPVNVAKVRAMRRSPLPCEELLLDIMNQDGTGFVSGGAEDLLLRLQGISEKEHFRVDCSNNPRLRVYQGKTYVEMSSYEHPEGPDYFNGALYHHVRRADDGKVVDVCDYGLTPTFSVRQESGSEMPQ